MAKTAKIQASISVALTAAIAAAGLCFSNVGQAVAADKNAGDTGRIAKLTDSPEGAAVNIGKQIKGALGAGTIPANLAKLYDFDPPGIKYTKAAAEIVVMAPQQYVWDRLTDFSIYPHLFSRLKTCQVLKREGDLVYIESMLKPQMFVSQPIQHTINDLEDKPDSLKWKLTDGNFKAVEGEWELKAVDNGQHTKIKYTIEADPGPLIPRPIFSMVLKMVEHEAISGIKKIVEEEYNQGTTGAGQISRATNKDNHS